VAIDPRPDPEDLSHALTSQVPRIHDSCHIYANIIEITVTINFFISTHCSFSTFPNSFKFL